MVGCSAAIASMTGGLSLTAFGSPEAEPNQDILVVVFLRGGCDGLSVVPPIAGADRAIIVTTPEVSAIRDADRIIGMVEAAELPEPDLIINRYRPSMVERGDMMNKEDILEILAVPLLGIVPDHQDIITSANRGIPVAFDDESIVGEAFRRVARKIIGEKDVPALEYSEDIGWWSDLKRWVGLAPAKEVLG